MTLVIISIVIFVSIVFLRLQEVFSYLIVNILGKDLTFTGRTVIWDYYINEIKNSWVIGYGVGYNPYKGLFAHNGFLDLMIIAMN